MLTAIIKYVKWVFVFLWACTLIACSGGSSTSGGGSPSSPTAVIFGNNAGLMFANNTLLSGTAKVITVDHNTINGVAVDSANNMYAATNTGKVYQYIPDPGNWVSLPGNGAGGSLDGSLFSASQVTALIINNNKMYAATNNGNVFVYTNNQWNMVGTNLNTTIETLYFDQNNTPYVGGNNGVVYKYIDNQWLALSNGNPIDGTQVNSLTVRNNILYAATNGDPDGQVYRYDSVGESWTATSTFTAGAVTALASDSNIVYAGTEDGTVYELESGTWSPLTAVDGTAITFLIVSNDTIYASTAGNLGANPATNGQVYAYNATTTEWTQLSTLSNGIISAFSIESNHFYVGTVNDGPPQTSVYIYESGAESWVMPGADNALDGTPIYSTTIDKSGNYYAGTLNNVFKYSLTSQSWQQIGNLYLQDSSGSAAITTYNSITYAGTFQGNVFYNSGNSSNWTLLGAQIQNSSITSLVVNSAGTLYASTNLTVGEQNYGNVLRYDVVQKQWVVMSGNGESGSLDNSVVQALAMDGANNLYAGTQGTGSGGQVWEYPANESSWILVGTGTPDRSQIQSLITDSSGNIYTGTQAGNVFEYHNNAWEQLGAGALDGSLVIGITFDSSGTLYGITSGGNVWYYVAATNTWYNMFYGPGIGTNIPFSYGI